MREEKSTPSSSIRKVRVKRMHWLRLQKLKLKHLSHLLQRKRMMKIVIRLSRMLSLLKLVAKPIQKSRPLARKDQPNMLSS